LNQLDEQSCSSMLKTSLPDLLLTCAVSTESHAFTHASNRLNEWQF
jgi:hypothetical protein